jgi:hypothetical protein
VIFGITRQQFAEKLKHSPPVQRCGIFGIVRRQSSDSPGGLPLLAMLLRESACRTFRHQFRQLATRAPVTAPWRHSKWAERSPARVGRWTPSTGRWHSTRLATKYRKGKGKASGRYPVDAGWPDDMKMELQACRSAADHRAWTQKWAAVLSGEAARIKRRAVKPTHRHSMFKPKP